MAKPTDSIDDCPVGTQRVGLADLVFCWPADSHAMEFKADLSFGFTVGQYWLGSVPVSREEFDRSLDKDGDWPDNAVSVLMYIYPRKHWRARDDWRQARANREIATALASLQGGDSFQAEYYRTGEDMRSLTFTRVRGDLFSAAFVIPENNGPRLDYEFRVRTSEGSLDYLLVCSAVGFGDSRGKLRACSVLSRLGDHHMRALIQGGNTSLAMYVYELMRARILSYWLQPASGDQ
ncbi:hypothetical protein [Dongia deserti]|uniref:hypothetical protein n=1 Tax=Dongia deserti TaxID=2268030 RepID=UPI0013C483EE|nr:hypothetical protein [Dongia deserti]